MTHMTLCTTLKPKYHDETFHDLETKVSVCKEAPLKGGLVPFPLVLFMIPLRKPPYGEGRKFVDQN